MNQCSICIQCLAWITFKKINLHTNEIETNNTHTRTLSGDATSVYAWGKTILNKNRGKTKKREFINKHWVRYHFVGKVLSLSVFHWNLIKRQQIIAKEREREWMEIDWIAHSTVTEKRGNILNILGKCVRALGNEHQFNIRFIYFDSI